MRQVRYKNHEMNQHIIPNAASPSMALALATPLDLFQQETLGNEVGVHLALTLVQPQLPFTKMATRIHGNSCFWLGLLRALQIV